MKKLNILTNANGALHRVGFKLKKHSPEILIVAGTIGTVASVVMACKATLKVNEVLEETKNDLDKIHTVSSDEKYEEKYCEEDMKKDLVITYAKAGVKLTKIYAPSVILGTLSLASIITSHRILRKRNIALAAAYTTVDSAFKKYRKNVVERFGDEVDKELRYGIKAREIETIATDENGNEVKKVETVKEIDPNFKGYSDYAKFFDCGNPYWEDSSEFNLMFINRAKDQANVKLRINKYLFLNDVYDLLGIPRTKAGQVVGWIYDEKDPNKDNYVDFFIKEVYFHEEDPEYTFYRNNPTILLDFNVDGYILDNMKEKI